MNRFRVVPISAQIITQWLRHGTSLTEVVGDPLPEDAVLTAVQYDAFGRNLMLVYLSDEFEECAVGAPVPLLRPTFESVFLRPHDPDASVRHMGFLGARPALLDVAGIGEEGPSVVIRLDEWTDRPDSRLDVAITRADALKLVEKLQSMFA